MARHIPFAAPVNSSEKWAFEYLRVQLPDHYDVLTNVELVGNAGSTIEIDAVVIGDWAVYLVDVKGYTGIIDAGRHVWLAHGEEIENPLPKLNKNCKIFASRLRRKLGPTAHTPWIQGLAFVTGSEGKGIVLKHADEHIAAYSHEDIVPALMEEEYVTLPKAHRLTDSQKLAVLNEIGQVAAVEKRANSIGDFVKKQKLMGDDQFSVWTATFSRHGLDIPYLLKCIERSAWTDAGARDEAIRDLRREFRIYQELTGAAGVPYVAPLIDTGEQVVLPIKHPRGRPVSSIKVGELDLSERLKAIRSAAIAIETIHSRGIFHGNITGNNLYIAEDLTVELLDFGSTSDPHVQSNNTHGSPTKVGHKSDVSAFASLFSSWITVGDDEDSQSVSIAEGLAQWFDEAMNGGESSLALLESLTIQNPATSSTSETQSDDWTAFPGAILNLTYELVEQIDRSISWSTWRAKHQLGRFDCLVRIYDSAEEQLDTARKEFEILSQLYHPGLNRTFDMGGIQGSDMYFMSMSHLSDPTLRDLIEEGEINDDTVQSLLRQVCITLEYLHKSGITHRNISPDTIIVTNNGPVLVDLTALPKSQTLTGDIRYKWARVNEEGWSPYADLYSLAVTALETILGEYPLSPDGVVTAHAQNLLKGSSDLSMAQAIFSIVKQRPTNQDIPYLQLFGLAEENDEIVKLPLALARKFNISKGYMTFLVLDMLNDRRPRSRNQWVLGALRSRNIPGNKTNKNSMSATVSRLKSAGIAEDHGKKIRLSSAFLDSARALLTQQ